MYEWFKLEGKRCKCMSGLSWGSSVNVRVV